ncbi:MAG: fibronectin type III domain-containing protein [Patescibacteria group bacterium]|nr:fibronectin type III domain-containing protein [Patescibacteria group bacterium]
MKNWIKVIFIGFIVLISIAYAPQTLASILFGNIQVSEIEDGKAKVKWSTPGQYTRGVVYFGESSDNLNRNTGYSLNSYYHEVFISGLLKKKTYYFKIVAIDVAGNEKESFIQSFSTNSMKRDDLIKPQFGEQKIMQITNNAVAIYWTTDEETSAIIRYGTEEEGMNKTAKASGILTEHELFIYKLKPGEKYHLKIIAKDRAGNETNGKLLIANTSDYIGVASNLIISNINPLSFDEEYIFSRRITLKFKTNLVAKAFIQYGTTPRRYNKKIIISKSRKKEHEISLSGLEPNTTYHYRIIAYDSFFKKKIITPEMTFVTKSLAKKISNGSVVKGSGYKVYVISGNEKFWIETADVFSKLGYKWEWIQTIDDVFLKEYKEGKSLKNYRTHPDGALIKYPNSNTVYLIENRKKRPISSAESFVRNGFSWDRIITISTRERYRNGLYL